jgi:hypothetical protein
MDLHDPFLSYPPLREKINNFTDLGKDQKMDTKN